LLTAFGGVWSVAAPAGAATLAPPVIRESFTLLPCVGKPGHRNTLDLEGCAERQVLSSDAVIDSLNTKIFAKLGTKSQRRAFISGHGAWLKYRHSYCLSASDVYQGGSLAGIVYIDCVQAVNSAHVKELHAMLASLNP
jgi:uncharacterized protein YecT (DUF1311 family)